jgi:hypothetical protein
MYLVEVVRPLTYSSLLVKGGQYLVEVVQPLTYSSLLVKGGQYLVDVEGECLTQHIYFYITAS